jgi:hypothetical protein
MSPPSSGSWNNPIQKLVATCLRLVSWLAYSSTMKTETTRASSWLFITTSVRSSNPTTYYHSHCRAMPTHTEEKDKERKNKDNEIWGRKHKECLWLIFLLNFDFLFPVVFCIFLYRLQYFLSSTAISPSSRPYYLPPKSFIRSQLTMYEWYCCVEQCTFHPRNVRYYSAKPIHLNIWLWGERKVTSVLKWVQFTSQN